MTVCGVPVALSATESAAVNALAVAGLNSTETVQLDPTARELPQVVADFRNELAFDPVIVSEVRVKAAVPVFLIVTTSAAVAIPFLVVAKAMLVGDKVTAGVPVPVPVNLTD